MTMIPQQDKPLSMPRRLAIRLLHEAQIATEPFLGLVTAASVAPESEPEGWLVAANMTVVGSLLQKLDAQERRAWALYFFRPSLPATPVAEDFAAHPALLRLTASLATKGVLQLRAWQCSAGRVFERELHVHD